LYSEEPPPGIFIPPLLANSCVTEQKKGGRANCVGGHLLEFILPFLSRGLSKHHTSFGQTAKKPLHWLQSRLFQLGLARHCAYVNFNICAKSLQRSLCVRAPFSERLILDERDEAKAVQRRYFAFAKRNICEGEKLGQPRIVCSESEVLFSLLLHTTRIFSQRYLAILKPFLFADGKFSAF